MSSLKFLLDTNILSEPLRARPNQKVMDTLKCFSGNLATASIVFHEMLYGCYRLPKASRKRMVIEAYLKQEIESKLPIITYDSEAASWHALERSRLVTVGLSPPFVDSQIAAIAAVNDMVLVTNNVADFTNFSSLKIENWYLQ